MPIRPLVWILCMRTLHAGNIDYQTARREKRLHGGVRTTEEIVIGGCLDEPAWSQGPVAKCWFAKWGLTRVSRAALTG